MSPAFPTLGLVAVALCVWPVRAADGPATIYAEIRVVDASTGRGVPLVELETVHNLRFVTDNAGRVAFHEPGLMGQELYFSVRSHGYTVAKDGFGFAGARLTPRAGQTAEIRVTRTNVAERLGRLTGEGKYRDSQLLGRPTPPESPHPGRVAGQDSVQAAVYRGRVFWFWGDTLRLEYPLGLYRMAGATTPLPDATADLANGLPFDYFVDAKSRFARAMMPLPERPEGVVWIFAVFTVPDASGVEKLVGHYSRRKGLESEYEQGIAVFNDDKSIFEPTQPVPRTETWRRPTGHPILHEESGRRWLLFGSPNPNVRVPATLAAVLDATQYEAYSCSRPDGRPDLDTEGKPVWRWQSERPPTDSKAEAAWVKSGALKPAHARFLPANATKLSERITLHSGSVRWNAHRDRWVMIAGQVGGKSSHLGEVWYAEARQPTGPFATAVNVVTHDRQTFYNVCHHAFLDRDGGRSIHFEGTYTNDFSGNPDKTPRYNYNQVLYRLDLDAPPLRASRVD